MTEDLGVLQVRCGDLVCFRSKSWLGRLIRWAERERGEAPSWSNHVGVIVDRESDPVAPLQLFPLRVALVSESVMRHQTRALLANHLDDEFSIYRYRSMSEEQARRIRARMLSFEGHRYGWWKLFTNFPDTKLLGGRVLFRKLQRLDSRPICSYSSGKSYADGGIYFYDLETFGVVPPYACQPDCMDDWARASEQWVTVYDPPSRMAA